jgi:hypothetical protein
MGLAGKRVLVFLLIAVSGCACFAQHDGTRTSAEDAQSHIVGTWRGNSVCMVKSSPCHDEINVYHFFKLAGKSNLFSVTASKVVEGKEIVMGSGEWTYEPDKRVVECKAPAIPMAVDGNRMEGTLTLADGTVYRRIYLKKED